MNQLSGQMPDELQPISLKVRLFALDAEHEADIRQKGLDPTEYVLVEWEVPRVQVMSMSDKSEYLMQAMFLIPPGFLKLQAGPIILGADGQPALDPNQILQSFFPFSLPRFRGLIRKADLSDEVPLPPTEEEKTDE